MVLGTLLTLFVGLFLGMVGGGGSILLLPILHYVMGFELLVATSLSLIVVGATAFVGAAMAFRKEELALSEALLFALPGVVVSFVLRKWYLPGIPSNLEILSVPMSKSQLILGIFVFVSFVIALRMIFAAKSVGVRSDQNSNSDSKELETHSISILNPAVLDTKSFSLQNVFAKISPLGVFRLIASGALTGALTAFVGAGGGFLIVPALTTLLKIPFRRAAAASLAVIALNASFGLLGDALSGTLRFQYLPALVPPLAASLLGLFVGLRLSKKVSPARLSQIFGFIILLVGVFTILKEIF